MSAGRLRTLQNQLVTLSGSMLGRAGAARRPRGHAVEFRGRGCVGVAATAGLAAIAFAYNKITSSAKEAEEQAKKNARRVS